MCGGGPDRAATEPERSQREIFPLPPLRQLAGVDTCGSASRLVKRALRDANACLSALNWLSGCKARSPFLFATSASTRLPQRLAAIQHEVSARICRLCWERAEVELDLSPKEALLSLLRGRGLYESTTAYSTLAAYKSSAVSLPESVKGAAMLLDLLPEGARRFLVGMEEKMLRNNREREELLESCGIQPYSDRRLVGSRREYSRFIRRLRDLGLVHFTRSPKESVGVFSSGRKRRRQ